MIERQLEAVHARVCEASRLLVTQLVKKRLSRREAQAALEMLRSAESQLEALISRDGSSV